MSMKEPLKTVLRKYCHVECYDPELIRDAIISGKGFPYNLEEIKSQLREAIDNRLISLEEYEELTEEYFDSQEYLQAWLEEFWAELP